MYWQFCLLLFFLHSFNCEGRENIRKYKGHKLIRVSPENELHLSHLRDLHQNLTKLQRHGEQAVDFWREPHRTKRDVDMTVHPDLVEPVLQEIIQRGLRASVVQDDISRSMEEQLETGEAFTTYYHQLNEIHEWLLSQAHSCYPNCQIVFLGNSTESRPLYLIKISTGPGKPAIFVDGGFHSREWISPATVLILIEKLIAGVKGEDATAAELLNKYTWYILPIANPDGYQYSWDSDRMWRKTRSPNANSNCIGTDLNRNFKFHWAGSGASNDPCSTIYHGPYEFSEPEGRSMAYFIWRKRRKIKLYLSFHSYGQYWLTPWGYSTVLPHDYDQLMTVGQAAVDRLSSQYNKEYTLGTAARVLYPAAGGSDDWAKGRAQIKYSFTVELDDTGTYGFLLPPEHITPVGERTFDALNSMLNTLWEVENFS